MAFSDVIYLIVFAAAFIILLNMVDKVAIAAFTGLQNSGQISQGNIDKTYGTWERNRDAFNNTFAAFFLILFIVSVILTIYLNSHPSLLVVWLLFNILLFYVYDAMVQVVDTSIDNGGASGNFTLAQDFFVNTLGKAMVVVNILLAIGLFGKRALS